MTRVANIDVIVTVICLIIVVTLTPFILIIYSTMHTNIDSYVLEQANKRAVDAAMSMLQDSSDVNIVGNFDVDPDVAYDMYLKIYTSNLYTDSEEARNTLNASSPVTLVAVNDGVYVKDFSGSDSVSYFTNKIPYAYSVSGTEYYVADTINGSNILLVDGVNNSYKVIGDSRPLNDGDPIIGGALAGEPNIAEHSVANVTSQIIDMVHYSLATNNSGGSRDRYLALPSEMSEGLLQDITAFRGIIFLNYIDDFSFGNYLGVSSFSLANSQLTLREPVGVDSSGYYKPMSAYGFLTSADIPDSMKVFTSEYEAAKNGYYPSPSYYDDLQ